MCISNDELNFKCSVSWGRYFNSWFARWAVSHSTGNDTGFQMIWLRRRTRTFSSQLPRGGSENPEGSRYLVKQTLNRKEIESELPQKAQNAGSSPCASKQAVDTSGQTLSVGLMESPGLLSRERTLTLECVGFLRFSYPACLIYQPTSEAHTWDSMRMQLYHTIPCPYPVGLEHSEQTLINPPVSECKSWSWELWAFFFSRCFHLRKIVQGLTHTFLLLLTPGNLQCIYRLYQFFISRNISVRTLQHADFGDWPSS